MRSPCISTVEDTKILRDHLLLRVRLHFPSDSRICDEHPARAIGIFPDVSTRKWTEFRGNTGDSFHEEQAHQE